MKKTAVKNLLGKFGFSLSLLCALHCLATPLVLAFIPAFAEFLPKEIELLIILLSFLIATAIVGKDTNIHKKILPLFVLIPSFVVLLVANLLAHNHLFDVLGIVGIFSAYLLNWHYLRKAKVCACA
jgi:hypothetical protein